MEVSRTCEGGGSRVVFCFYQQAFASVVIGRSDILDLRAFTSAGVHGIC